jgi:hypothetical protein
MNHRFMRYKKMADGGSVAGGIGQGISTIAPFLNFIPGVGQIAAPAAQMVGSMLQMMDTGPMPNLVQAAGAQTMSTAPKTLANGGNIKKSNNVVSGLLKFKSSTHANGGKIPFVEQDPEMINKDKYNTLLNKKPLKYQDGGDMKPNPKKSRIKAKDQVRDYWLRYLENDPELIKITKRLAKEYNINPGLLFTTMAAEGLLDNAIKAGKKVNNYGEYSGIASMGLDTAGTVIPVLQKKGLLPKDLYYEIQNAWDNEKGEEVISADFKTFEDAYRVQAAYLNDINQDFTKYAEKNNITIPSGKAKDFFLSVGYNAGKGNMHEMASSYNKSGFLKNDEFLKEQPSSFWEEPYMYNIRRNATADHTYNKFFDLPENYYHQEKKETPVKSKNPGIPYKSTFWDQDPYDTEKVGAPIKETFYDPSYYIDTPPNLNADTQSQNTMNKIPLPMKYGGYHKKYGDGGQMNNTQKVESGLLKFKGPTHANGGIPFEGVEVEGEETNWKNYIFSDRLKYRHVK